MTGDGGRVPRPTRERLLDAAVEALLALTAADLVTAIGTREIARRAEVSPAAFFHHFGSVADFAQALIEHVFAVRSATLETTVDRLEKVRGAQLPVDTEFAFHRSEFARLTESPDLPLRTALSIFGGPPAAEAYRRYLNSIEDRLSGAFDDLVRSWGREARPPFDIVTLTSLHTALAYGAVLRHWLDPERLDAEDFMRAATSLNLVLLRLLGDRHTVEDRLAEINYYPLRDARTGVAVRGRRAVSRARILAAASALFAANGYDNTSIAAIARGAHVSESTVYEQFATKASLASALWVKQAGDRLAARPDTPLSAGAFLRQILLDLAGFAGTHIDRSALYLTDLVCHAPAPAGGDEVRRRVALAVDGAQRAGECRADLEAVDLADLLLSTLINRVLGRPGEGPERSVAWVLLAVGAAPAV